MDDRVKCMCCGLVGEFNTGFVDLGDYHYVCGCCSESHCDGIDLCCSWFVWFCRVFERLVYVGVGVLLSGLFGR